MNCLRESSVVWLRAQDVRLLTLNRLPVKGAKAGDIGQAREQYVSGDTRVERVGERPTLRPEGP